MIGRLVSCGGCLSDLGIAEVRAAEGWFVTENFTSRCPACIKAGFTLPADAIPDRAMNPAPELNLKPVELGQPDPRLALIYVLQTYGWTIAEVREHGSRWKHPDGTIYVYLPHDTTFADFDRRVDDVTRDLIHAYKLDTPASRLRLLTAGATAYRA